MSEENDKLKGIKSLLRAVLMSSKEGVEAKRLLGDYSEFAGKYLPYKEMGFSDIVSFMRSIPDVAQIRTGPTGEARFFAIADQTTAHIQKMVSKQRSSKRRKKPLPRIPQRRPIHSVGIGRPRLSHRPSKFWSPPPTGYSQNAPQRNVPHLVNRYGVRNHAVPSNPFTQQRPHNGPDMNSFRNYKITVGGADADRSVNTNRVFQQACSDISEDRQRNKSGVSGSTHDGNSRPNYEVPPRFQRKDYQPKPVAVVSPNKAELWDSPESPEILQTTVGKWCDEPYESYDNMELLEEYCHRNDVDIKFTFRKATINGVEGYLCLINIHDKAVGSVDVFDSEMLAKEEASKNVCKQFNITEDTVKVRWSNSASSSNNNSSTCTSMTVPPRIKQNIKELLSSVQNSMWGLRFPVAYKEKFHELPDNLIDMVRACPDIARIEMIPVSNKEVIYPVREEVPPLAPTRTTVPSAPKHSVSTPVFKQSIVNPFKNITIPPAERLKIGSEEIVYVAYAESCHEFYIQLESSCSDDIHNKLQAACKNLPKPNVRDIKKGIYCSALYSTDQQWYRAEVLTNVENERVKVRFVDFGNIENVTIDCIRQLPSDITNIPKQAIYCSLYGIQPMKGEEWSRESLVILGDFVRDQQLIAIPSNDAGDYEEVELYRADDRQKSLNQILIDSNEAYCIFIVQNVTPEFEQGPNDPELMELPDEKFLDIYVSLINPSLDIVVRIVGEDYSEKLEALENRLEAYYKLTQCDEAVQVGMVYVASIDSMFHRVKVCSIEDDKVECYILDHGDIETIGMDCLRPLNTDLNKSLPYQALKIELYGLGHVMHDTTTQDKLIEMALGKICVAEIMSREEKLCAVLYDMQEDEININEYIVKVLISEGHALDLNIFSTNVGPNTPTDTQSIASSEGTDMPPPFVPKIEIQQNLVPPYESTESGLPGSGDALSSHLNHLSLSNNNSINQSSVITVSDKSSDSSLYTWGQSANENRNTSTPTNDMLTPPVLLPNQQSALPTDQASDQSDILKTLEKNSILPVGEMFAILILWIMDPSSFVCVRSDLAEKFRMFDLQLNDYFAKAVLEEEDPVIGELYAGCIEEKYFRVIVKSQIEEEFSVYLPDYGQYMMLEKDDFQPLHKKFCSFPFMAIRCRLHGVTHEGKHWSEAAKYTFMEIGKSTSLYAIVSGRDEDGVYSLRLIDTSDEEDVCVDELLVSKDFARLQ